MNKSKIIWSIVLIASLFLLVVFGYNAYKTIKRLSYRTNYNLFFNSGMMRGWFNQNKFRQNYNSKMSIDEVKSDVENFLKNYSNDLIISDIFVFEDSDYYVSVKEKQTGKGAMELLVNPYTGYIYPEYGPNMMWNEKYGMHRGNYGMGMMRYLPQQQFYSGNNLNKIVDKDTALKLANDYIKSYFGDNYSVMNDGHEFYGYYTFHVNKDNKPFGMVSANFYTGDVWYHNWHGKLEKIISVDES